MSVMAPRTDFLPRLPTTWAAPDALVRAAAARPPNFAALLPACAQPHGPAPRVREGVLRTPHFQARRPWLSLAVPGWTRAAMLAPTPPDIGRGEAVAARMCAEQLGGACWAPPPPDPVLRGAGLTLVRPCGGPRQGRAMLAVALARENAARVVLLVPERGGWAALVRDALAWGVRVAREPVDPWPLLGAAVALHAGGDDDLALLGLVAGVRVHCHGAGAYAGWDAEDGAWPASRDARHLVAAALIGGLRCADPFRARPAPVEETVDQLAAWRRQAESNRGVGCLAGMSVWKRRRMREMFHDGIRPPPVRRTAASAVAAAAARGGAVAVWSSRVPPGLLARAAAAGVPVRRVEDGFIRSVGLGCDFLPPCSVVADGRGMYFDPSRPSDLEHLLFRAEFTPALCARGRRLIDLLVRQNVTKYNTGAQDSGAGLAASPGRRRILVPGQVADDASVRLGGGAVQGNLPLLAAVRAANPNAFIIYKPHPDVQAGHRPGTLDERSVRAYADHVVTDASIPALVAAVDEVHTLTSLAGFEALLRGRGVVAYGQPFYAGWGLTADVAPVPRRGRQLQVEELVAGALILYPRYHDPLTGLPCPPELLVERLAEPGLWRPGPLARLRRLQGWLRRPTA